MEESIQQIRVEHMVEIYMGGLYNKRNSGEYGRKMRGV